MNSKYFCVLVKDKVSGKKLYINFLTSDQTKYPDVDYDEATYTAAMLKDGPDIDRYKIPFEQAPLFYSNDGQQDYVIFVRINRQFARRRVDKSASIRDFVVSVVMSTVMDNLNKDKQKLGHSVDLDHAHYRILQDKTFVEPKNLVYS